MAQNVTIAGVTFADVPSVEIAKSGGGSALFVDPSPTTATAADVASGKSFFNAAGTLTAGTASGGGGATVTPLTVTQNGTYTAPEGTAYSPVTVSVGDDPEPTWPTDGNTHLWITTEGANVEAAVYFSQSAANGVSVNWGDGTTETIAGTDAAEHTHTYAAAGDYEIVLTELSGKLTFSTTTTYSIMGQYTSEHAYRQRLLRRAYISTTNALGSYTFNAMRMLRALYLTDTITTAGMYMCRYCSSLEYVHISSSMTQLPAYAFAYCSALRKITLPASVTLLNGYAFQYATALERIELEAPSVNLSGNYVFSYCYCLRDLDTSRIDMERYTYTFRGASSLQEITITPGITGLTTYCFGEMRALASVTIPASVTSIAANAFYGNVLTDVYLLPTTPPTVATTSFSKWNTSGALTFHVPVGTRETYLAASGWSSVLTASGNSVVEMPA